MRNIKLIPELPYDLPEIIDITDQLPKHKKEHYESRRLQDITTIIIHHTVSTAPIANMAKSHINNEGWPGIGYHLMIERDRLYQVNDLNAESFHAKGWNDKSIGVAIVADLTTRPMTDVERMLLYGAILTVKNLYPSITSILGHNEAAKELNLPGTACPATDMHRIRNDISGLEVEMLYHKSTEYMRSKAYEVRNNVEFVYNLANGKDQYGKPASPQEQRWAVKKLLELYPAFKQAGLMK